MFIVVGNGIVDQIQNKPVCVSLCDNALEKYMNPSEKI